MKSNSNLYDLYIYLKSENKDYFEGVRLLKTLDPSNVLITGLESNINSINRIYLIKSLECILKNGRTATVTKQNDSAAKREAKMSDADWHRISEKDIARLYAERRSLSNQLHDCKTDNERAEIVDKIKDNINEVSILKNKILIFKTTGKMPAQDVAGFEIPTKAAVLMKKILNWRSKVAAQKRVIANYDAQPRIKSKAAHELHLAKLESQLHVLENAKK